MWGQLLSGLKILGTAIMVASEYFKFTALLKKMKSEEAKKEEEEAKSPPEVSQDS